MPNHIFLEALFRMLKRGLRVIDLSSIYRSQPAPLVFPVSLRANFCTAQFNNTLTVKYC